MTWKIYNPGGIDDVPSGENDDVAVFSSRWAHDPRTTASQQDYVKDCNAGTLPQVDAYGLGVRVPLWFISLWPARVSSPRRRPPSMSRRSS